ncbi:hypothetical protein BJ508DRAFT_351595 [Ascobolus immersus RN42]|uniref:Uncharacterized protein n=1 Tax=Ascobolus immersus RN42 TaxID=1160509 RepID=A0A3N4HX16_ASCIM|nr:hypothetical protein BJ508DRAFT_351595 [Ascobolus immersus RN42]
MTASMRQRVPDPIFLDIAQQLDSFSDLTNWQIAACRRNSFMAHFQGQILRSVLTNRYSDIWLPFFEHLASNDTFCRILTSVVLDTFRVEHFHELKPFFLDEQPFLIDGLNERNPTFFAARILCGLEKYTDSRNIWEAARRKTSLRPEGPTFHRELAHINLSRISTFMNAILNNVTTAKARALFELSVPLYEAAASIDQFWNGLSSDYVNILEVVVVGNCSAEFRRITDDVLHDLMEGNADGLYEHALGLPWPAYAKAVSDLGCFLKSWLAVLAKAEKLNPVSY